jgi:hypothetical protein
MIVIVTLLIFAWHFAIFHMYRISTNMNKFLTVALSSLFAAGVMFSQVANAASDCEAKAVSKAGKPLAGAAKTAFLKKCEADTKGAAPAAPSCADKAVDKNGKPLAGAAKNAFMKKCESAK